MKITSTAFEDGKPIPSPYTCDGKNISPELIFSNLPTSAKSLALIMDDPDIPRSLRPDGLFVHWLVWNMAPTTAGITEGGLPAGVVGLTTSGQLGYMGPCPPSGEHRYFFRLYALDTELLIPTTVTKAELLQAMQGHIVDQAELMGRYTKIKA